MVKFFDYEILHRCQYPVPSAGTAEPEMDCGEPAAYLGYWIDDGGNTTGGWWLCQEHFDIVQKCEAEAEALEPEAAR